MTTARLYLLTLFFFGALQAEEKHLTIIIPSYNNIAWYKNNLDSLAHQTHPNWHAIYIDDCSTDGTGDAVATYITQHNLADNITLIKNNQNHGALYNIYHTVHACNDDDVILLLDGDDWLKDDTVLATINNLYQDQGVWLTYGTAQLYPANGIIGWRAVPEEVITTNSFRHTEWLTTHLRTFYAWLFKKIKKEDLLYNGEFFSVTWDLALMFPMLEMAGIHSTLCPQVVYVYNMSNPISDYNVRLQKVLLYDGIIRGRTKYEPVTR